MTMIIIVIIVAIVIINIVIIIVVIIIANHIFHWQNEAPGRTGGSGNGTWDGNRWQRKSLATGDPKSNNTREYRRESVQCKTSAAELMSMEIMRCRSRRGNEQQRGNEGGGKDENKWGTNLNRVIVRPGHQRQVGSCMGRKNE